MPKKKNKNTKFREPRSTESFFAKHWFDLTFVIILILFLTFESICIYGDISVSSESVRNICASICENIRLIEINQEERYYINGIIFAIVPIIDTIMTLSITIPDFEIYGLKYHEFRKIRGDYDYNLASMVIISIVLLGLCVITYYFDLFITTIYLNALAIFYLILFMCKEFPILAKNDRYLFKVIKKSNDHEMNNSTEDKTSDTYSERQLLLNTIKLDLLIKYGFIKTFKILRYNKSRSEVEQIKKDYALINDLISIQNNFLTECNKNINILKINGAVYQSYNVYNVTNVFCDNILCLIENRKDIDFARILADDSTYMIGRSILILREFIVNFDLEKSYTNKFQSLVVQMLPCPRELNSENIHKDSITSLTLKNLNYLLTNSIKNEELWFVEAIKFSYYEVDQFYNYKNYQYLIFVTMYMNFMLESNTLKDNFNTELKKLVQPKWASDITKSLRTYRTTYKLSDKLNLLDIWLNIYETDDRSEIWNSRRVEKGDMSYRYSFGSYAIISWLIEYIGISLNDLDKTKLSVMKQYLNPKNFDTLIDFIQITTQDFTYKDEASKIHISKKKVIKSKKESEINANINKGNSNEKHKHFAKEKETTEGNEIIIDNEGIDKRIELLTFYKDSKNIEIKNWFISRPFRFITNKGEEASSYLKLNMKHNLFCALLTTPVKEALKPYINDESIKCFESYSEDTFKQTRDLNPNFKGIGESSLLDDYLKDSSEENKTFIDNLKTINSFDLSGYDIYCTSDAIEIYVKKTDDSHIGELTSSEIEKYIADNCTMSNGLYKFNSDKTNKIFYNRSSLEDAIRKEKIILSLDLTYNIKIAHPEKIILVKTKYSEN